VGVPALAIVVLEIAALAQPHLEIVKVEQAQHRSVVNEIALGYEHASVPDFDVVGMGSSARTNLTHRDGHVVRSVDQFCQCCAVHISVTATRPNVSAA